MRNVESHLLEDKMDEAVSHYISSHQPTEPVHPDTSSLALNVQDATITVIPSNITSQICSRVGEPVAEGGAWAEELLEPDARLAAIMAHLAQHPRTTHHQPAIHHKVIMTNEMVQSLRSDVDSAVMLDPAMRLFNGQTLEQQNEPIVVEVPQLPPLPPLQDMKRCPDSVWFNDKDKSAMKNSTSMLPQAESQVLEMSAGASPTLSKQQSKKSLPHKKRISKKLKRNAGSSTPQQDVVIINCNEQEEILPDNYVTCVPHQEPLPGEAHLAHEVRPILLCQICGEFYGEDQYKFYQHLKQHYEPHATIIIENPVADLPIVDKMTNTCIVDNVSTLPDSIVELSLENTVPKTMYQPIDKHVLYTTSDKTLNFTSNKVQYSMASMDKETAMPTTEAEKAELYDTLCMDKLGLYNRAKCSMKQTMQTMKKQKQTESHVKDSHVNTKMEDMSEFSEPEDLMEGIHVSVEDGEHYEHAILPHLTVDNGHVHQSHLHQEHARNWYLRNGSVNPATSITTGNTVATSTAVNTVNQSTNVNTGNSGNGPLTACGADGTYCPVCPTSREQPTDLKVEALQRIFEVEAVGPESDNFTENIIAAESTEHRDHSYVQTEVHNEVQTEPKLIQEENKSDGKAPAVNGVKKKGTKRYVCGSCGRVFQHRNSLLYHELSHSGKGHQCRECGKTFYTAAALKVHRRVHSDLRPYKCDECGREFRQWSDLKYHKISLHSNQKQFKCEFCGKDFARKYSLSIHRRIHTGERNYKCEYCTKTFRASSYRLSHMRTHTGDKPYKCIECEKCFRVAGDLNRHMITHEKGRIKANEQKRTTKDDKEAKKTLASDKSTDEEKARGVKNDDISPKPKKPPRTSTTKPQSPKTVPEKKPQKALKKSQALKKDAAPNVTVTSNRMDGQFKGNEYTNNVQVFIPKQVNTYSKFKDVYTEANVEYSKDDQILVNNTYKIKDGPYSDQAIIDYKDSEQRLTEDRDFAILKPMFKNVVPICNSAENDKSGAFANRTENTDGKMAIFTHVDRTKHFNGQIMNTHALSDIRGLERDVRSDGLHGETIENGFLERLTSLYNISAV